MKSEINAHDENDFMSSVYYCSSHDISFWRNIQSIKRWFMPLGEAGIIIWRHEAEACKDLPPCERFIIEVTADSRQFQSESWSDSILHRLRQQQAVRRAFIKFYIYLSLIYRQLAITTLSCRMRAPACCERRLFYLSGILSKILKYHLSMYLWNLPHEIYLDFGHLKEKPKWFLASSRYLSDMPWEHLFTY